MIPTHRTLFSLIALALFACDRDTRPSSDGGDAGSGDGGYDGGGSDGGGWGGGDGGGDGGDGGGWGGDGGGWGGDSEEDEWTDDPGEEASDTGEDECDEESPVVLYLSPDDSNSMASPVLARLVGTSGWSRLSGLDLRPWEFMNYYDFPYDPPERSDELALYAELRPGASGIEGEYELQLAIASPDMDADERPPMNLALSIDTSGSMQGEPLELATATARAIAGSLRAGDVVSVLTWSGSNSVVLERREVTGPDDSRLLSAISSLESGGGTDLEAGLEGGYDLVASGYDPSRINRVILISDGGANLGSTSADLIGRHASDEEGEGIYLVGVGVGTASTYDGELMDTVTDLGKGASVFIDSKTEAERMFSERFVSTVGIAAREVSLQLDLPPGFEFVRTTAEQVSEDPDEVEPQHLAPDDAMVFNQTIATCAVDELDASDTLTMTVRWMDPLSFEEREQSRTWTLGELDGQDGPLMAKGIAVHAYTDALHSGIRSGPSATATTEAVGVALRALEEAEARNPGDRDLDEIRAVLKAF